MENYIDKINKDNVDYEIRDSNAARSVDGDASHVALANNLYSDLAQAQFDSFIYRTTAGRLSISNGPATLEYLEGNTILEGYTPEVLTETHSFANDGVTLAFDKDTWRALELEDGDYTFSYDGTDWKLGEDTVTIADYGFTITGTAVDGDFISVNYVALVIGTMTTATPATFVSTGFNQYNGTYAYIKANREYRIAGTYTGLGFTPEIGGTTTPIEVIDDHFAVSEDGYVYVTGGSGDILIALVWSGTRDTDPYEAYSASTITVPTTDINGSSLPTATYGMPSVGNVRDRLNFSEKLYIQRVGHYTYSAENLEIVKALGTAYIYDANDIFFVLPSAEVFTLADTVSGSYTANDYGTEEITGTEVAVPTLTSYGNNLIDKLRNLADIQTIGNGLTLTANGELSAAGGGPTVVQTTGTSTTDVMSQDAVSKTIFADANREGISIRIGKSATVKQPEQASIAIGQGASASNYNDVAIGRAASTKGNGGTTIVGSEASGRSGSVAIGKGAGNSNYDYTTAVGGAACWPMANYSVAIGAYSMAESKGEFSIGGSHLGTNGYNNTSYRKITNVHDGENAHDAATYGQLQALEARIAALEGNA